MRVQEGKRREEWRDVCGLCERAKEDRRFRLIDGLVGWIDDENGKGFRRTEGVSGLWNGRKVPARTQDD